MKSLFSHCVARVYSTVGLSCLVGLLTGLPANPCQAESPPQSVLSAQKARQASMALASRATIAVFGLEGGGGGSGVIITPDGYALTNFHVTSACGDHMRVGLSDGRMVDAVIVGIDATGDVSLIKLIGDENFPIAPMADSSQVRVGQWCFAAGNPFGLATNLQPTVSLGVVSGVGRYQYPANTILEYSDCIQTDAAINPGNSGGPLFNLDAEIIGINGRCSFEKRGRVNVGVGYAISINQIKNFLGMLRSGRLVDHATLGATMATDESGKVLVSNILNGSDAYRRGLRYGDELVSFAGRQVDTTNDFKNILGTLPKDWRVPMVVRREGELVNLLVRLTGVHTELQLAKLVAGESPEADPHGPKPKRPGEQPDPDKKKAPEDEGDKLSKAAEQAAESEDEALAPGRPNFKLVKTMLEARDGFANFYFNRMELQQVWTRIQSLGDFRKLPTSWTYSGKYSTEPTPFEVQIHDNKARLQLGRRGLDMELGDDMAAIIDKNDNDGLVVGLRAWQELLQKGPEGIGATIYLGTAPIYPTTDKTMANVVICDVLQSNWYDCVVRYYVPVGSAEISCIEVQGDPNNDPVEIYFDRYREADGRKLPGRLRMQYGTEPSFYLDIDSITPSANATTEPDQKPKPVEGAAEDQGDKPKTDRPRSKP